MTTQLTHPDGLLSRVFSLAISFVTLQWMPTTRKAHRMMDGAKKSFFAALVMTNLASLGWLRMPDVPFNNPFPDVVSLQPQQPDGTWDTLQRVQQSCITFCWSNSIFEQRQDERREG